jgi:hypothetical protein
MFIKPDNRFVYALEAMFVGMVVVVVLVCHWILNLIARH